MAEFTGAGRAELTVADRVDQTALEIFRLGIRYAAFSLRATDSLHLTDEQLDWCARMVEREADNMMSLPSTPYSQIAKGEP